MHGQQNKKKVSRIRVGHARNQPSIRCKKNAFFSFLLYLDWTGVSSSPIEWELEALYRAVERLETEADYSSLSCANV